MINETKAQLFEVFRKFDTDGSGCIDPRELIGVAQEMQVTMVQSDVERLMKNVDKNNDKKISFDEFWEWWQCGKDAKLEELVFLKFKLHNMLKGVHEEFTRFGASKQVREDNTFSNYYMAINHGDHPNHFKALMELNFKIKGIADLIQNIPSIIQKDLGDIHITLQIMSVNPELAKQKLTALFSQNLNLGGLEGIIQPIMKNINVSATKDQVIINIPIKNELINQIINGIVQQILSMIDPNTELLMSLLFGLKNSLKKMMTKKQPFVKQLVEGFILEFKAKFNNGLLDQIFQIMKLQIEDELRTKALIKNSHPSLLLLLRAAKLHLVFKNIEDVDQFFQDMGLEGLLLDQPTLSELAKEVLEGVFSTWETKDFKAILQVFSELMIAIGEMYVIIAPHTLFRFDFNFEGLDEIYLLI